MNKYKQLYEESLLINRGLLEDLYDKSYNPEKKVSFNTQAYTNMLTSKDMILCANRYVWKGLPINLTSQQLEAMLYQWGTLCMFENNDGELVFSRYVAVGNLNPYGLLDKIQPIDMAGNTYDVERAVIHSAKQPELTADDKVCIIVNDYTTFTQFQEAMSRFTINSATTIHDQVLVHSQLMTNVFVSVKKALALCETEEQKNIVMQQVKAILDPSQIVVPISATRGKNGKGLETPIELFNFNNTFDTQNYCQTIDYFDKLRRSFNGIPSPDTFEKKERKITAEAEDTSVHTNLVLLDGLLQRQNAIRLFTKYCKNPNNQNITCNLQEMLIPQVENDDDNETDDDSDKTEAVNE